MNVLRTYATYVLLIELVLVVLIVVGLTVPLPGRVEFKIVQSGSMEPAMPVGSVVAVVPRAEYGVGDIITFGSDTKAQVPTTHRIVGVTREGGALHYLTKGDANEEADNAPVPHSAVIGAVELTVPRLGYVLHFARTERGFFFMAVVPALLIILDELLNIFFALRARRSGVRIRGSYTGRPTASMRVTSMSDEHEDEEGRELRVTSNELRARRGTPHLKSETCKLSASIDGMRIVLRPV